jgi:hypothetical protein
MKRRRSDVLMRLDAREGHYRAIVYHAELCRVLRRVVWVDDAIPAYGEFTGRNDGYEMEIIEHRASKIVIGPDMIIINPVEDEDEGECEESVTTRETTGAES